MRRDAIKGWFNILKARLKELKFLFRANNTKRFNFVFYLNKATMMMNAILKNEE